MAINKNKVQLQETVLDSNGHPLSSTDVNPLTSSDCVIMENGMTLEDVMGNDTVIDTPTIMNEDTSFKVGIGDSETKVIDSDVAKMVMEGKTYQNILPKPTTLIMETDEKEFKINDKIDNNIVLDDNVAEIATIKGQTYVNAVQEESASEYVAIGEELNGQSITTTGKPDGVIKNATLEGMTLVNTIQEPSEANSVVLDLDADINAQSATIDNTVQGGIKSAILKGSTKYRDIDTGEFLEAFEEGRNLELVSVKMPVLKATGKNLFDGKILDDNKRIISSGLITNDSSFGITDYIPIESEKFYISNISGGYSNFYDNNKVYISTFWSSAGSLAPNNAKYIRHSIEKTNIDTYMFEQGTQATSYEPFKSNILTVNEDVVLRGIGDVKDTLDCLTGEVTERIGEIVLDGSENWVNNVAVSGLSDTHIGFKTEVSNGVNTISQGMTTLCDKFMYSSDYHNAGEICKGVSNSSAITIVIKKERLTTHDLNGFKSWLQANNLKVQYPLATESIKTVDLSIVDQDNNPLKTIQAQPTLTHITTSSNGLIPFVTIPSQLKYPTIIKPSTTYTVQLKHTTVNNDNPLTINLGGAIMAVPSAKFTITTPSELTSQDVIFTGKNNVIGKVVITEGDTTGIEYRYFEGMNDVTFGKVYATGKNLFDMKQIGEELNKIKPIIIENNSLTITSSPLYHLYECRTINFKPNREYTLSANIESNDSKIGTTIGFFYTDGSIDYICRDNNVVTSNPNKTIDYIKFSYGMHSIVETWSNIQLEEGSTATSYEPYKGLTIEQSIDSIPLTSNMFEQGRFNDAIFIKGMSLQQLAKEDSTIRIRSSKLIPVKPNAKYIINVPSNSLLGTGIAYSFDKNGAYNGKLSSFTSFTTKSDTYFIAGMFGNTDSSTITPSDLDSLNLTLQEVPQEIVLRSLPNGVKDTLNLTTGEYVQRVGEMTFDGSSDEAWIKDNDKKTNTYVLRIPLPNSWGKSGGNGIANIISDKYISRDVYDVYNTDIEGIGINMRNELNLSILNSKLSTIDVEGFKQYLSQNPITVQYELATPIITKVNLTNTTKLPSYNSTTHYDTIVPSNSLIPNIKLPSTIDYNVAIKPSTQYTVRCNTTNALSVNLGGSTGTLANGKVTTLTTPSTLAHNSLKLGNGKAKEVMVIEDSEIKDNVPFFNGMKNVQMGGIKLVNIARYKSHANGVSVNANKTTITFDDDGGVVTTAWGQYLFHDELLKPNTMYTIFMNVIKNTSTNTVPVKIQLGNGAERYTNIKQGFTGNFVEKIVTSSDISERMLALFFRRGQAGEQIVIQNPMIIEGDWTHLDEIPYIESEMIIEQPIIRSQGKNLSDGKLESGRYAQNQGVPFSDNTAVRTVNKIKVKPSTVYTLKIEDGTSLYNTSEYCNGVYIGFKTAANSLTFTTSPTTNELHLSFKTDNINLQYQIEEGSSATTYEPFKQHTLSSNRVIGYEEGVHYGGITGIKSTNPNFNSVLADVEGLSIAYVTNGSSNFSFWDKDMVFISGKSYLDTSLSNDNKNGFIQVPSNAKYMKFASANTTGSPTNYTKATVTGELPLRSLPNGVCDSFNLVTGEYVQRVGEVVLDGSDDENWVDTSKTSNNKYRFGILGFTKGEKNTVVATNISCDSYIVRSAEGTYRENHGMSVDEKGSMFIYDNIYSLLSLDAYKQYLKQNPITIQYELATPIVRKIGLTAKGNYKEIELNGSERMAQNPNLNKKFHIYDLNLANDGQLLTLFTNKEQFTIVNSAVNYTMYKYRNGSELVMTIDENINTVDLFKRWLSQNPIKVGHLTNDSASLYSNIQKPIFFNDVKVQFMNDNVDIQPTLTLQSTSRNSYVMDMMKANTVYTLKALANPNSFTIDGTSYSATTNGAFTSPSTLTNKLLITGLDVQELMIIEGDVTGKQLPYYKGIRSSFDNTDKVEVLSKNKNLVKELYPMLNDNTCVIENGVVTIKGNGDGSGELNCVFNPSIYLEKDKTYTFSFSSDAQFGKTNGTDTVEAFLLKDGGTGYYIETYGFTRTFICGATGYYNIRFDINKNNTTHKFWNIQLVEGNIATPYQPHQHNTTSIPMPTQLETVEVVKPVLEVGRILTTDGQNDDNDTGSRRSKDYIPVKPGMILTFMNGNTYRAENIYLYGIDKNYIGTVYTDGSGDLTIPKDCYFIRFYSGTANTSDITVIKKQYKPIALNELPNGVKDELIINRATSSAKLIKRVGKIVLDGSEDWKGLTEHNNNFRVALQISNMKYEDGGSDSSTIYAINDKLPTMKWHGSWNTTCDAISCNTKNIHIHLANKHYATINLFKEYLKQNPITVYYELAEPVITEISLKGYPFVYEDGNITLNTDIAPVTRTSYNVNQHQLINSQNETIIRHDKQISGLYDYIEIYLDEIYRMELFKMQLELSL